MKSGHAHEESLIIAALLVGLIIFLDRFFDFWDDAPGKGLYYPVLFMVLYGVIRLFRRGAWR